MSDILYDSGVLSDVDIREFWGKGILQSIILIDSQHSFTCSGSVIHSNKQTIFSARCQVLDNIFHKFLF